MPLPMRFLFVLAFLAVQATAINANAGSIGTLAPNVALADGSPGYVLKKLPGKRKPPTLLVGINPTDACDPIAPCTPQALSLSDPTRPSLFSDNHLTDYTLFFGLQVDAGATTTIPGDPCSSLTSDKGVQFGIGGYIVQLFATPADRVTVDACTSRDVRRLSFSDPEDSSNFTAFSLSIRFTGDTPVTFNTEVLDSTGALSYGGPASVPEPPALILLAGGICALFRQRRRRLAVPD